jgi:hypothetical protein
MQINKEVIKFDKSLLETNLKIVLKLKHKVKDLNLRYL